MKRGVALPVALFTLALLSALAVSGVFVTRLLVTSATASLTSAELEPMAERALVDAVAGWDSAARAQQPLGTVFAAPTIVEGGARIDAWITRIGVQTYWLVAESTVAGHPTLHRRIGVVVRVVGGAPQLLPDRAWSEFP